MTGEELAALLFEDEGTTLDFKRDEYLIFDAQTGCNLGTQAEFIKDMLAFANTARRTSAIIVLGANKAPGQRAEIVGIASKLDNAHVEEFINGKINRPIAFTYSHSVIEGKAIGIIEIPPKQKRPFHLRNNFGGLNHQSVFVRRNSSTAIASLDEIAQMGQQDVGHDDLPVIKVALWDPQTNTEIGTALSAEREIREYPADKEIPDYEGVPKQYSSIVNSAIAGLSFLQQERLNHAYYREQARFHTAISRATPINIVAKNVSGRVANDVRVKLYLSQRSWHTELIKSASLPNRPEKLIPQFNFMEGIRLHDVNFANRQPRIAVSKDINNGGVAWQVELVLGKMQPGQSHDFENCLFISTNEIGEHHFELAGAIFGDEIPQPIPITFTINLVVMKRSISLAELTGGQGTAGFKLPPH